MSTSICYNYFISCLLYLHSMQKGEFNHMQYPKHMFSQKFWQLWLGDLMNHDNVANNYLQIWDSDKFSCYSVTSSVN